MKCIDRNDIDHIGLAHEWTGYTTSLFLSAKVNWSNDRNAPSMRG